MNGAGSWGRGEISRRATSQQLCRRSGASLCHTAGLEVVGAHREIDTGDSTRTAASNSMASAIESLVGGVHYGGRLTVEGGRPCIAYMHAAELGRRCGCGVHVEPDRSRVGWCGWQSAACRGRRRGCEGVSRVGVGGAGPRGRGAPWPGSKCNGGAGPARSCPPVAPW